MGIDRDDRRMSSRQVPAIEFLEDEVLYAHLIDRGVLANPPPNFFDNIVDDFAHVFGRIEMTLQLLITPNRFKYLNEIGG